MMNRKKVAKVAAVPGEVFPFKTFLALTLALVLVSLSGMSHG